MPITDPLLLRQWHPLRNGDLSPRQVSPGSHRKVWWRCDRGHEWQAEVKSRALLGTGCPVCAGKAVLTGVNDLATLFPQIAAQWDRAQNGNLSPGAVRPGSHKKVWWRWGRGHRWQASVASRTAGEGCPVCAGKVVVPGENDLATLFVGGKGFERFLAYNTEPDGSGDWYRYGQCLPDGVDTLYAQTVNLLNLISINLVENSTAEILINEEETARTDASDPYVVYVDPDSELESDIPLAYQAVFTFDEEVALLVWGRTESLFIEDDSSGTPKTYVDLEVQLDERLELGEDNSTFAVTFQGGFQSIVYGAVTAVEPSSANPTIYNLTVDREKITDNTFTVRTTLENARARTIGI